MSNIILEEEEFALLADPEIFLVKKRLGEKISVLLSNCIDSIDQRINECPDFPEQDVLVNRPKISKGENYLSYPWHILDYPRLFNRDDIFAVRTLCWWGQSFSITSHLSGKYAERYHSKINSALPYLAMQDYYVCVNDNQWQHHFGEDNYIPAKKLSESAGSISSLYDQHKFIKIMKKIPLSEWPLLSEKSTSIYRDLFKMIGK